jgi:hypothetical protein
LRTNTFGLAPLILEPFTNRIASYAAGKSASLDCIKSHKQQGALVILVCIALPLIKTNFIHERHQQINML